VGFLSGIVISSDIRKNDNRRGRLDTVRLTPCDDAE